MRRTTVLSSVCLAVLAVVGVAPMATGSPQAKPKNGYYVGSEKNTPTPLSISFSVARHGTRVTGFGGQGIVKSGCKLNASSFGAGIEGMKVSKSGTFKQVNKTYIGYSGVTVTVHGHFSSSKKAAGYVAITVKHKKDCNAARHFSAKLQPRP
jgi:hypothetical protein